MAVANALDPRIVAAAPFAVDDWFVVLAHAGSNAHGTVVPRGSIDDVDYLGCFYSPAEDLLGLERKEDWQFKRDELDVVTYSLEKMVRLWLKSNPNVLGLLWTPYEDILVSSPAYEVFRRERGIFVSKAAYPAFIGYAHSQFKKMTSGQLYEGYMGQKRRALVDRYGFDPKNASHLIRVLRMGIEFLVQGQINVNRTGIDAEELKAIKRGDVPLADITATAEALFRRAEEVKNACTLPERPDRERANELLIQCQRQAICR